MIKADCPKIHCRKDMERKLVFDGHKYNGRFKVKLYTHADERRINTKEGYYNQSSSCSCWKGIGIILNKQTGKERRFLIYPRGGSESDFIVLGNEDRKGIIKRIYDYQGIVDLVLNSMYEFSEKSDRIVPKIAEITPLNINYLTKLGLLTEESGQMTLSLGI